PTRPPECEKCWDDGIDGIIMYGVIGGGLGWGATRSIKGTILGGGVAAIWKMYDVMQSCKDPCYDKAKLEAKQVREGKGLKHIDTLGNPNVIDPGTAAHEDASNGFGFPKAGSGMPS